MAKTKRCALCKRRKPVEKFHRRRGSLRNCYCIPCQRKYHRKHYLANRKDYIDKTAARRKQLIEEVQVLKHMKPCVDCKKKYPHYVLDFDHVGKDKTGNVSYLMRFSSRERTMAEIKKCELVCANCHRERTHSRRAHLTAQDTALSRLT